MAWCIYADVSADERRLILMPIGAAPDPQAVNDALLTLTPAVRQIAHDAVEMDLSWPAVVQLANEYGPNWAPAPRLRAWIEAEVRRRLEPLPDRLSFELPYELQEAGVAPRPHQVSGAHLIARTSGGRAVLWDEPRTGKTVTTILGLREIAATWWPDLGRKSAPIIVICPKSVVTAWVQHFRAWWPERTVTAWHGSPYTRRRRAGTAGVYVTSWGTAAEDAQDMTKGRSPLVHLGHAALVVDEGHLGKDPSARRTRAMERLARRSRVFIELTGSPITHTCIDLQPRIQFLNPGWLPSKERMRERWARTARKDYGEPKVLGIDPARAKEFYDCIEGQWRWLMLDDVSDEAPRSYKIVEVDMPPEWRAVYDSVEEDMLARLPDGTELASFGTLAQLQQLQQLANAAGDCEITYSVDEETGEEKAHYHVVLKRPSWKVDALIELLDERRDKQVLVFAPSRQLIEIAAEDVESRLGLRVGRIVGGQSRTARDQQIELFQSGVLDVMCSTTGAGGVGVTLNAGSVVIFLQRPWSSVDSAQSEKRIAGIGASAREESEIIDIVTRNSVEWKIRKALKGKAGQLSELVRDPRVLAQILGGATVTKIDRRSA